MGRRVGGLFSVGMLSTETIRSAQKGMEGGDNGRVVVVSGFLAAVSSLRRFVALANYSRNPHYSKFLLVIKNVSQKLMAS